MVAERTHSNVFDNAVQRSVESNEIIRMRITALRDKGKFVFSLVMGKCKAPGRKKLRGTD